jgi:hypothetical protein
LIGLGILILGGIVVARVWTYRDFLDGRDYLAYAVLDKSRMSEEHLEQVSFRLYNLYVASGRGQTFRSFLERDDAAQRVLKRAPRLQTPPPEGEVPANGASNRPVWPVFLGGLAFLYLWWVAAVAFDLAVVWQHFIRRQAILRRLERLDDAELTRARRPEPPAGRPQTPEPNAGASAK